MPWYPPPNPAATLVQTAVNAPTTPPSGMNVATSTSSNTQASPSITIEPPAQSPPPEGTIQALLDLAAQN